MGERNAEGSAGRTAGQTVSSLTVRADSYSRTAGSASIFLPVDEVTDRLNTAMDGRYRIERHLGAGGMATVNLAQDLKHDRQVAEREMAQKAKE